MVSLTSPTSGQAFMPGSSVQLAATANDSDGTISRVEFRVMAIWSIPIPAHPTRTRSRASLPAATRPRPLRSTTAHQHSAQRRPCRSRFKASRSSPSLQRQRPSRSPLAPAVLRQFA
ncbi:MAG: hypothetical protein HC872_06830 [Gammaproteobacteria bacterium]|nr:hypothetical protein [Gammaproteobacteria bacterium]